MRNIWNNEIVDFGMLPQHLFDPLINKVSQTPLDDYKKFSYNFTRFGIVFKFNQTVVVKDDRISLPDMKGNTLMIDETNTFPVYDDWKHLLDPVCNWIIDTHLTPGGLINKLMLSNIIPSGGMQPHWDEEPTQLLSKRIHIVLTTNSKSEFVINEKNFYFVPGSIFELNNLMVHSVNNHGDTDRVHLIMDYYHEDHLYELLYGTRERDPDEAELKLLMANNKRVDYSQYPYKKLIENE
jgi:hypothetical protein